jgi:hypothetical protein
MDTEPRCVAFRRSSPFLPLHVDASTSKVQSLLETDVAIRWIRLNRRHGVTFLLQSAADLKTAGWNCGFGELTQQSNV